MASISRSSLIGMVVVSWLSILLLGGLWIGKMYYDFSAESDQLRSDHYAAQKALVRSEVEKALVSVDEYRRTSLKDLWGEIRARAAEARVQAAVLASEVKPAMTPQDIGETVAVVLAAGQLDKPSLFSLSGNTVYLIQPFPELLTRRDVVRQLDAALKGAETGERQLSINASSGNKRYTLMLLVEEMSTPPLRIVSGACFELAEDNIKQYVARRLEAIHFGKDGYLFGATWQGVSTVGPAKGKNMWDVSDAHGVKIVQELIAASKRGGDFVSYIMPKIGERRQTDKISFAMPIPDWEWYIGAGLYVDEIESVIDANRERLEREIGYQVGLTLSGLCLLSIVAFMISRRLARKMQRNIQAFTDVWNRASTQGDIVDPDSLYYEEFKVLASAANRMVDDRRAIEALVTESETRFRTLVSNIPGIVYQCALDDLWSMHYISDSVKNIVGYPASDFMDNVRSFASVIDPRDRAWLAQAVADDVKANQAFSLEYRIVRRDGDVRWVFERGQARYDEDGNPQALDGVIIDITEKRKAEEEHYTHIHFLETMERIDRDIRRNTDLDSMLSETMETIRVAFGADRSWLLFPCDPSVSAFKVPVERHAPEFPGAGASDMEVALDDELRNVLELALEASGPIAYDPTSGRKLPSGLAVHFGVQSQLVAAIYPRTGKPWLMGMHQCSNARVWNNDEIQLFKEASRRVADALSNLLMYRDLKESEEKFRTFSEQTTLGICMVQDNLVKFANQAYCDIFEVTVEEMLSLPPAGFLKFVHPEDQDFLMEQARKKQGGDKDVVETYTWRAVTSTGKIRWVEIHSKTVIMDDRPADLVSLVDITEMRRSKGELEQLIEERTTDLAAKASELEAANQRLTMLDDLKSSFLTTVSHDLRTPLTSVLGYAKLIRKDLEKMMGELDSHGNGSPSMNRIATNLEVMETEGARLSSLIDDFMDLTSIQAGTATWYDRSVAVGDLVDRVVKRGAMQLAERPDVDLVVDISEDLPRMNVDSGRFEQMLGALLKNAILYTCSGTVTVQAESPDGLSLSIVVSDTGKGIPDGELETIFEPFHQVEIGDTLVDKVKGSGLGLSLCRGIVEHYNGTIRVESYLGKGSTFYVKIPGTVLGD